MGKNLAISKLIISFSLSITISPSMSVSALTGDLQMVSVEMGCMRESS